MMPGTPLRRYGPAVPVFLAALGWLPGPARADFHCPRPEVDAGEVRCGQPLAHQFTLTNRGTTAVEVLEVRPGCGCLVPRLNRRVVGPGSDATLEVEINTLSQAAGRQSWPVRVVYRDGGGEAEATLRLAATVVAEIDVRPAAVVIHTDRAARHVITLTDPRPKPLSVLAVNTSSPHLQARAEKHRDGRDRWAWTVHVEVGAGLPEGRHDEVVSVVTDDPAYPELKVAVAVVKQARSQITAAPSPVTFRVQPGEPIASRVVLVRTEGTEPVAIEGVEADDPAVVCRWASGPDRNATVRLSIDRGKLRDETMSTTVRIRVSKPVAEVLTVPVRCAPE